MGRRGIRGLKAVVGREYSISRGGARLYRGGIHAEAVLVGVTVLQEGTEKGCSFRSQSCQEF